MGIDGETFGGQAFVSVDFGGLSATQTERLSILLRDADFPNDLRTVAVSVPQNRAAEVEAWIDEIRELGSPADGSGPARHPSAAAERHPAHPVPAPRLRRWPISPSAGPLRRGLAVVADSLLLNIAYLTATLLPVSGTATWLVLSLAFPICEWRTGFTPGKSLLNIRVFSVDGKDLRGRQAFLRNVWQAAVFIPFFGLLLAPILPIVIGVMIGSDADNRGPHDKVAGTIVKPVHPRT